MIGILTQEDAQGIIDEMTLLKGEVIKLRQDFNELVEELKKAKK